MPYETILVHVDIDDPSQRVLDLSWQLARALDADMIGFCACNTYTPAEVASEGGFEAQFYTHQLDDIGRLLEIARKCFEGVVGTSGRASWRGLTGDPTRLLVQHARAADLIVSGRGNHDLVTDGYRTVDAGNLLLSAGRPVLLLGPAKSVPIPGRVLVCWKDTREARRAIADSVPLLKLASDVLVASVEEHDLDGLRASQEDITGFLAKHGIRADTLIRPKCRQVGDALFEIAHEIQADLVVAGAFGHSRLREWAFGGATRALLTDTSVHRLFSN